MNTSQKFYSYKDNFSPTALYQENISGRGRPAPHDFLPQLFLNSGRQHKEHGNPKEDKLKNPDALAWGLNYNIYTLYYIYQEVNTAMAHALKHFFHIEHWERPIDILLFFCMALSVAILVALFVIAVTSVIIFSLIRLFNG